MELNHFDVPQGRWTTIEFLALLVIIRKKKLTEIVIQKKIDETYVYVMYNRLVNHVIKNQQTNELPIRIKCQNHILLETFFLTAKN